MPDKKKILTVAGILAVTGAALAVVGFFTGAEHSVVLGEHGVEVVGDATPSSPAQSGAGKTQSRNDDGWKTQKGVKLGAFTSVDGNAAYADISFVPSDHYGADLTYYKEKPEIAVSDGTLRITQKRKAKGTVGLFLKAEDIRKPDEITVYYPRGTRFIRFGVADEDGDLEASGLDAQNMDITCKYGGLKLKDCKAESLNTALEDGNLQITGSTFENARIKNSYGGSSFDSVQVTKGAEISASDGTIGMSGCKAASLTVSDSYGGVSLSSLHADRLDATLKDGTLKVADSTIGDVRVKNAYGGVKISGLDASGTDIRCNNGSISLEGRLGGNTTLHSDYGSVSVRTSLPESQYACDCSTSYGSVTVNGKRYKKGVSIPNNAKNSISVSAEDGDISVDFAADSSENTQTKKA